MKAPYQAEYVYITRSIVNYVKRPNRTVVSLELTVLH